MKKPFNLIKKLISLLAIFLVAFLGGAASAFWLIKENGQQLLSNSQTTQTSPVQQLTRTTPTTQAVATIQAAVVSVLNYQTQSTSIYNQIFGQAPSNQDGELVVHNEGSGVIYKKEGADAYLVTNTHVVDGAEKIEILLADGSRVDGQVVGADTYSDIAVVKISGQGINTIGQFADSSQLTIGEPAIAIGSPLGSEYANSVTQGIVSSLSRTVTSTNEQGETVSTNAIQTDAAINPGNSGGPLINLDGQIIGINSSKVTSASRQVAVEGMGFAIPSNDVVALINQLEEHGQIIRPAIGINMADLSEIPSNFLEDIQVPAEVTDGIVVANVLEDMPAFGKLEKYDIITAINDQPVSSASDLQSILYKQQLGDQLTITFYRNQVKQTVDIDLTKTNQDLTATR